MFACMATSVVMADVNRTGTEQKEKKKKKEKEMPVIPEGHDTTANFVAGQSVDIELEAATGSLKQVEFIIRKPPQYGTLSAPRPHPRDNNKAVITYQHSGVDSPLADSFAFAGRIYGGPFSAPATVTLYGKKFDPILDVINTPQFGKVFVGGESVARVTIKNTGVAPCSMPLAFHPPWSGPSSLDLAPGKTTEILIGFRPQVAGNYRHKLQLQPGIESSILYLYGDCVQALTVTPGRLSLGVNPKTGERTGVLKLVNSLNYAAKYNVKLPARLQGQATVDVAALGAQEIVLKLPATDVQPFQGELILEGEGTVERAQVEASAKPSELKLVSPDNDVLDFAKVEQGSYPKPTVIIANVGGQALVTSVQATPPFSAQGEGQTFRLDPGQEHQFPVQVSTASLGKFAGELRISGGATTRRVELRAEVVPGTAPIAPPLAVSNPANTTSKDKTAESADAASKKGKPKPQKFAKDGTSLDPMPQLPPRTPAQLKIMNLLATQGPPKPATAFTTGLEGASEIEVVARTSNTITLAWKKTLTEPFGWRVETSQTMLAKASQAHFKVWNPVVRLQKIDGDPQKVTFKILGLKPATQYEFRTYAGDKQGKLSPVSPTVQTSTLEPWRMPAWVWRVLLIGGLGIALYVLLRVRRGDFELEF